MAGREKHALRSHRTYHKNVDFSDFNRKALIKGARQAQKGLTLLEKLKSLFHKTTNK